MIILIGFLVVIVGVIMMFGMFKTSNPIDNIGSGFVAS